MTETVRHAPGAAEVAAYLRRHPDFLSEHPELAQAMRLPRGDGSTTSLAGYQLEVLRDKNRELNRRLHELFETAHENERLTVRTHQLTLALMRARNRDATLASMVACLVEDFGSELVRLVMFQPAAGIEADWHRAIPREDAALAPFADFLSAGEPLCGRLQPEKTSLLFGGRADEVRSIALLPIGMRGMLAIGSREDARFYPGMGTLFLRLMAEALEAALSRFDERGDTAPGA